MTPTEWLLSGDTGTSSKTICAVMTGSHSRDDSVPHDPDDFGRCYRLLLAFPVWRLNLHKMGEAHKAWGPMVAAWGDLEALYAKCCDEQGRYVYKKDEASAKALYERMKKLVDEGRLADGWTQTGRGSWSKGNSFSISIGADDLKNLGKAIKKAKARA